VSNDLFTVAGLASVTLPPSMFASAFLATMLANGTAAASEVRGRFGIPGTKAIGAIVMNLHESGMITPCGHVPAAGDISKGHDERRWRLTARGRRYAEDYLACESEARA